MVTVWLTVHRKTTCALFILGCFETFLWETNSNAMRESMALGFQKENMYLLGKKKKFARRKQMGVDLLPAVSLLWNCSWSLLVFSVVEDQLFLV